MVPSIIKHFHFDGADISFRKKFRLFFTVGVVVLLLGCIKTAIHYYGFEFLELNRLLTSGIGGAIFIIGCRVSWRTTRRRSSFRPISGPQLRRLTET